jgi:predicted nucleic acid-binding protein
MAVIDCSVLISRLLTTEIHHRVSRKWLRGQVAALAPIRLPAIVLSELSGAVARRTGSRLAANEAVDEMLSWPNLSVMPVDRGLAEVAADLASRLRTRGMDSIYLALAYTNNASLVTWDRDVLVRGRSVVRTLTPS